MERDAVTLAIFLQILAGNIHAFLQRGIAIGRNHRTHFFAAQRINETCADRLDHDGPGALRHTESSHFSNRFSGLTDGITDGLTLIIKNSCTQGIPLLIVSDDIAVICFTLLQNSIIVLFVANDGLLTRADDTVVIRTTGDDLGNSHFVIIALVNDALDIARANAQGGTARAVCGSDHAGTTGGNDHISGGNEISGMLSGVLIQYLN